MGGVDGKLLLARLRNSAHHLARPAEKHDFKRPGTIVFSKA
jgi:hypothetical protein